MYSKSIRKATLVRSENIQRTTKNNLKTAMNQIFTTSQDIKKQTILLKIHPERIIKNNVNSKINPKEVVNITKISKSNYQKS